MIVLNKINSAFRLYTQNSIVRKKVFSSTQYKCTSPVHHYSPLNFTQRLKSSVCIQAHYISGIAKKTKMLDNHDGDNQNNKKRRKYPAIPAGLALLAGFIASAYLIDARVNPLMNDVRKGKWDYNWDAAWRPFQPDEDKQKSDCTARIREALTKHSGLIVENEPTALRSTKQVLLLRHGQYQNAGENDDDIQGLTELGREQAHFAGKRLSELLQTYVTGVELIEDSSLAEGVPTYPEPPSKFFHPTNIEVEIGNARIEAAFQKYFFRPPTPTRPPTYDEEYDVYDIIVCHGNVIRYMFCRALQFPSSAWLRLATFNCGVTWLSVDNRGFVSAREFGNVGFIPTEKITYF